MRLAEATALAASCAFRLASPRKGGEPRMEAAKPERTEGGLSGRSTRSGSRPSAGGKEGREVKARGETGRCRRPDVPASGSVSDEASSEERSMADVMDMLRAR